MHECAIFSIDINCSRRTPALPANLAWLSVQGTESLVQVFTLSGEVNQEQLGQLVEVALDLHTTDSQYINFTWKVLILEIHIQLSPSQMATFFIAHMTFAWHQPRWAVDGMYHYQATSGWGASEEAWESIQWVLFSHFHNTNLESNRREVFM